MKVVDISAKERADPTRFVEKLEEMVDRCGTKEQPEAAILLYLEEEGGFTFSHISDSELSDYRLNAAIRYSVNLFDSMVFEEEV